MNRSQLIKYISLFFFSLACQFFLMDNLSFYWIGKPHFYLLFFLLLPRNLTSSQLMMCAFLIAICIDAYNFTNALHAAVLVFVAFLRPFILSHFFTTPENEDIMELRVATMGRTWFFLYTLVITSIYSLLLFFLEAFAIDVFFFSLIFKALANAVMTTLFIFLSQLLIFRN